MKKFVLPLIFGVIVMVFSCKNDKSSVEYTVAQDKEEVTHSGGAKGQLFDPCSLISPDKIGDIFSVDPKNILIKNDQYSGDFSRSCNLKWTDTVEVSTFSILIILESNPIPGEIDDWATSYLDSRIMNGEKSFPDNGKSIKYVKFDGIDSESAYNAQKRKLYWKINKDYVMAVFMSDSFESDQINEYLIELHNVLTKNILKKLK